MAKSNFSGLRGKELLSVKNVGEGVEVDSIVSMIVFEILSAGNVFGFAKTDSAN